MTIISVARDPITRTYDVLLRLTEADALLLAGRILAEAETAETATTPPTEGETDKS